jgi:phospholipid/cholesterol/gamma-HCH transport system ATP-binding protein
MIRFEHVTKVLGGRKVLSDLTFKIRKGEVFTIVGSSGSGKSVMLKHMVRLLTPTSGSIWVDDVNVSAAEGKALEKVRDRFGYLFQNGALLGWMNVYDNVALPLREKTRLPNDAIDHRVMEVLKMVGLENDGKKLPNEISGGMQKRAGLARAIVRQPEIVLYDEPTSGLDPVTSRTIDHLIRKLNTELGITSVVVTHDLQGALTTADRIAMLADGRFIEIDSPANFIKTDQPQARAFLDAQFISKESFILHTGTKGTT